MTRIPPQPPTSQGFTLWRSAATGAPWWRAVKIGEASSYEAAALLAFTLSRQHGTVRVLPTGQTPACRDNPRAAAPPAWIEAHHGATIWLQHGPSASALLLRAVAGMTE